MQEILLSYRYRIRPLWPTVSTGLFAFCAVSLFDAACNNNKGLTIKGLLHFSADEATGIYWLLAACSVGFTGLSLVALALRYTRPRYVTLSETEVSFPKKFFSKTQVTLPLGEIDKLYIQSDGFQNHLAIVAGQKTYYIPEPALPNNEAFDTLFTEIARRSTMRM